MSDEALFDLLDTLARRYALAAVWELRGAPHAFGALAGALGAPASVLTQRLRELREAGLVEVDEAGDYRLTAHGRRLQGHLEPLASYAEQWAALSPRQRTPRGSADRGRGESA
ncbi:MAG TPA: winged helix-turn-helix transcriptional regulator [Mycobacteriales bacterium]